MDHINMAEIDYPIKAEWQSPRYRVHKYWGRKPWNIVSEYIRAYTKEGGIVLDPYVGGGTTAYEAIKARRKVIAFDINPVATFITKCMLEPINTFDYELAFEKIESEVKQEIEKLYSTRCKHCGEEGFIKETIWQRRESEEIPIQITYNCICSKKNLTKKEEEIDKDDQGLLISINRSSIPFWYPRCIEVPQGVKIHKPSSDIKRDIHEFFTHRSIIALSRLKNAIENLDDGSVKKMMLYAFSASLAHSSKLISIKRGSKSDTWKGSSWIVPGLYVLGQHCERNVWYNFELKYRKILKTKGQDFEDTVFYKPASSYEDIIQGKGTAWIETRSAEALDDIPNNGVDFVFADPPYYKDILYTGQSVIFGSWLGMDDELSRGRNSELTLNPKVNLERKKSYYEMLQGHFSEIRKKLVPGSKAIVAFESADPEEWDALVKSMLKSGMKCEKIILHPQAGSFGKTFRYSHNGRKTSKLPTLGTYYMRFIPDTSMRPKDSKNYPSIEEEILSILQQRGEPTPLLTILTYLYGVLPKEVVISLRQSLLETMKSLPKACFSINDSLVSLADKTHLLSQVIPLREQVKDRIKRIVVRQGRVSSPEIHNRLTRFFVDTQAVDYSYIDNIISELTKEGLVDTTEEAEVNYICPTRMLRDKAIEHTSALFYLGEIGKRFGLNVWIGKKYHKCKHNGSALGRLCTIPQKVAEDILKNQRLLQDADIIWMNRNRRPIYHFEVQEEYDRVPDEVIQRSRKLSSTFTGVRRIIVGNDSLSRIVRTQEGSWGYWDYLGFDSLEGYFNEDKARQSVNSSRTESKIYQEEARIISKAIDYLEGHDEQRAKHCVLRVLGPQITKDLRPGQFVAILCSQDSEVKTRYMELKHFVGSHDLNVALYKDLFFLRRPFSVHRIYYKKFRPEYLKGMSPLPSDFLTLIEGGYKDNFDILFKIVGRGTGQLARMGKEDKVFILGPLGNGISDVPLNTEVSYLIAGGIGIAPLYAVAEHLRWLGIEVKLIAGGEEKLPLDRLFEGDVGVEAGYPDDKVPSLAEEFEEIGCKVYTVLASEGQGNAVQKSEQVIEEDKQKGRLYKDVTRIYACGPLTMLKDVASIADKEQIKCEVLLEKRMGCCIGACLSCVCDTYERENDHYTDRIVHKRVCYDGPVFNSKEVKW